MPITVNDGFLNNSPRPLYTRYFKNGLNPYTSIQDANTSIFSAYRHRGMVVAIDANGYLIEYWYKEGIEDIHLIRKANTAPQKVVTTGTYDITQNDEHICVNAISDVLLILPTAAAKFGFKVRISRVDGTDYNVRVQASELEKINNFNTVDIPARFCSYSFEAMDLGTTGAQSPGWLIVERTEPFLVEEEFTPVLRFNQDKIRYPMLENNITYSLDTSGHIYGKVITDIIEASPDYIVNLPENFIVDGYFRKGVRNTLMFTVLPQTGDPIVLVTIRQEDSVAAPSVSDLHIMGDFTAGDMVMAMYDFTPTGQEGDSVYSWYKADNASGLNKQLITGETGEGFVLTNVCDKYIQVAVAPVNTDGQVGLEQVSSWEGPVTGCTAATTTVVGAFTPLSISNNAFWLRADQGVLTSSGLVTQWSDQSPNSNHFIPSAVGRRPSIINGLNGLPGIQFSGTHDLRGPALSDDDNYTIFTVGSIGLNRGLDTSGAGWSILAPAGDNRSIVILTVGGVRGLSNTHIYNMSSARLLTTVINTLSSSNTQLTSYDNGVNMGTTSEARSRLRSSGIGFLMGQGGSGTSFNTGNMQEVIVYNRTLTSTEITNVHNYLKSKYNIA